MIMRRAFRLILFASVIASFFSFKNPARERNYVNEISRNAYPKLEQDIFYYINIHRRSVGLKPLQLNNIESSVALQHSCDMAVGKTPFGHEGLQKRMKIISRKIGRIYSTGENVASGQMSAKEVVDGWLQSPGHRRNIEGDFTLTGIGVAKDRQGVLYYTQIFTK